MKRKKKKPTLQQAVLSLLCLLLFLVVTWVMETTNSVLPPSEGKPAELYSNHLRQDLKQVFLNGIQSAKKSITLIIYTLTDPQIIEALKQKSKEGITVKVVCDGKACPSLSRRLGSTVQTKNMYPSGLMHQKILVTDDTQSWIGSTNLTSESLKMHGNLVAGLYSPSLAAFLLSKAESMASDGMRLLHKDFNIGDQRVEMWFLPDDNRAVNHILQMIETAKKSLRVAMFTFTRQDFAQAIIDAKNRGVQSDVIIDFNSGKGASAIVVKLLKNGGVAVRLSNGTGLLHHKFALIDENTLINGSANWTKAAFTKNDDCFMILHNLKPEQKQFMAQLWDVIFAESVLAK